MLPIRSMLQTVLVRWFNFFVFTGALAHIGPWPPPLYEVPQSYTYRRLVGLLGRVIGPSQGRYLHRTTQTE
jgi:hypothetical protein